MNGRVLDRNREILDRNSARNQVGKSEGFVGRVLSILSREKGGVLDWVGGMDCCWLVL